MSAGDQADASKVSKATKVAEPSKPTVHVSARISGKATGHAKESAQGQVGHRKLEQLLVRTLSGAVYALAILVCLYLGTIPTAVIVAVMACLCCSEYFRMVRMAGRMPNELIGLVMATIFPLIPLAGNYAYTLLGLLALMFAIAIWYILTPRATAADVATSIFGPVYTSLMFASIVGIRVVDPGHTGAFLTFAVMASVWLNDVCAYFIGSRFGTHKLAPQISPHKSVEGFWGGMVGGIIPWLVLAALRVRGLHWGLALIVGLVVSISAVLGDLFESRIKRGVGVKDSGNIIPGHGGMLDRADSMLFAGTIAWAALLLGGIL